MSGLADTIANTLDSITGTENAVPDPDMGLNNKGRWRCRKERNRELAEALALEIEALVKTMIVEDRP